MDWWAIVKKKGTEMITPKSIKKMHADGQVIISSTKYSTQKCLELLSKYSTENCAFLASATELNPGDFEESKLNSV